jgi:hypothetical protein
MRSLQIPDPPPTPNGDAWLEIYRGDEGIQYCSEDGSATIWLSLVSDGRRKQWAWTSHEVIVGIDMWELRESWERGPEPASVTGDVSEGYMGRDERLRSYGVRKAEPLPDPVLVPASAPEPEPEPAHLAEVVAPPAVSADVHRTAEALAKRVWLTGVQTRAGLTGHGIPPGSVDAWIRHAVDMRWVVDAGV